MACPTGPIEVKPTDPRINYNLAKGDFLETCPYNKSHAVLSIKFHRHVANCHRLHVKEQQAKGAQPLFSICKWDRSHHIENALRDHHEANCPSQERYKTDDGWGANQELSWNEIKIEPVTAPTTASRSTKAAGGNSVAPLTTDTGGYYNDSDEEEEEDWDKEPAHPSKFNASRRIHQLRATGYGVIRAHDIVGLTKSEKKAFYAKDQAALESYRRQAEYEESRRKERGEGGSQPVSSINSGSMYGESPSVKPGSSTNMSRASQAGSQTKSTISTKSSGSRSTISVISSVSSANASNARINAFTTPAANASGVRSGTAAVVSTIRVATGGTVSQAKAAAIPSALTNPKRDGTGLSQFEEWM